MSSVAVNRDTTSPEANLLSFCSIFNCCALTLASSLVEFGLTVGSARCYTEGVPRSHMSFTFGLVGALRSDPFVDLLPSEVPEAPQSVCRHSSSNYPPVNGVSLNAEVGRNLVYREPPIFRHGADHLRLEHKRAFRRERRRRKNSTDKLSV